MCRFSGSAEPPTEGDRLTELKYETLTPAVYPDNLRRYCASPPVLTATAALAVVFGLVVLYQVVPLWQVTTF